MGGCGTGTGSAGQPDAPAFGSAAQHLLRQRRLRSRSLRTPVRTLLAFLLALVERFSVSSMRTVRNLITESCTRRRRSNSFTVCGSAVNCIST
jgi:hypothetical protein